MEIEIHLARGVQSSDTVDALYAFSDCESSISTSMMVIKENRPHIMSVSDVIAHNAERLVEVLTAELEIEQGHLRDRVHAKTLEQIFIENRVYKQIEEVKTAEAVLAAVMDGMEPYKKQIKRQVTREDVETLLRIPIRRISQYDIDRAKQEMRDIQKRLNEIKSHLGSIKRYAIAFLQDLVEKYRDSYPRRTEIVSFERVDVREAAQRNLKLRYDRQTGYLGHSVNGSTLFDVSPYDRVLVIRKTGVYAVHDVPEKLFVDKGMLFCGFVDEERVYTLIYKDTQSGCPYIKRFGIDKFILNRGYSLVPEGCRVLKFTTEPSLKVLLEYKPKPRVRILEQEFTTDDYPVRGNRAKGIRLSTREVQNAKFV